MHHAPAVSFPLARSRFLAGLLAALALAGFSAIALWCAQQPHPGWRQGLGIAAAMAGSASAFRWWASQPIGVLRWEAGHWQARLGGLDVTGSLSVQFDLQTHLLLRFCCAGRRAIWLWLDRDADPAAWRELRRAAHAAARVPSDSGRPSKAVVQ